MIEIICGVYGGKDGMKRPGDKPFRLSPEEEARLVARKVARYVPEPVEEVDEEVEGEEVMTPIGFDETPPEDFTDDTAEDEAEVEGEEIVDLATLSAKELRELGKEYGLSFKANASKVSMIEAITAAQAELDEPAEDAPTFDASEAVL